MDLFPRLLGATTMMTTVQQASKPCAEQTSDTPTKKALEVSKDQEPVSFMGKLGDVLFPWKPESMEAFIAVLFWHSMAMTAMMPLERARGQWQGTVPLPWMLNQVGLRRWSGKPWEDSYIVYPREDVAPGIDRCFSLHAACGILWLVVAYVQMVHVKKWGGRSLHRRFGRITALAFFAHMAASINVLYQDILQHRLLAKVMLASVVTLSSIYFAQAMKFVRLRENQLHADCMVRCFLYSIEGAGTVRTIGWIMWLLDCGPTFCQAKHSAMATHCVWPYVCRMFCTRLLTVYWLGYYTRLRGDPAVTKMYMTEVKLTAVVSLSGLLAAWIAPPDDIIEFVLSQGNSIAFFCVLALYSAFAVPTWPQRGQ